MATIGTSDIPSDPITDLKTTGNRLSVWFIDDEQKQLEDVVSYLSAPRHRAEDFVYALIDEELLPNLQIRVVGSDTQGTYPAALHRTLINLTAKSLIKLAQAILNRDHVQWKVISSYDVKQMLASALLKGVVRRRDFHRVLRNQIERLIEENKGESVIDCTECEAGRVNCEKCGGKGWVVTKD
jgi:hypothetical protein